MNDNEKEMKRMQRILQECDFPSKPEDDSEGESDLVEEDEVVSDSDCHKIDSDDLQGKPPEIVPRCGRWLGKDKNTRWQEKVPKTAVRTQPHNIFQERPRPKGLAVNAKSPIDFWGLFISPEIIDFLVQKTNIIIQEKSLNYKQLNKARDSDIKALKAFYGLDLSAGIYHSNGLNLDDLWNPNSTGVEIF